MEPWTIKKILDWSNEYFAKNNIDSPKLTAQILLSEVLNVKRIELFLEIDRELTDAELAKYKQYVIRRTKHEPLEYIIGNAEFMGHKYIVNKNILIPRPETELLVEEAFKIIAQEVIETVVDIGTGSGCIAISIAKKFPDIMVYATDISKEALEVAKTNAYNCGVKLVFEEAFFPASLPKSKVMIISNPPYILSKDIQSLMPEVRDYEPHLALDGGIDGMDVIRKIVEKYEEISAKALLIESGYDQLQLLENLCKEKKIENYSFLKDYNNLQRMLRVIRS